MAPISGSNFPVPVYRGRHELAVRNVDASARPGVARIQPPDDIRSCRRQPDDGIITPYSELNRQLRNDHQKRPQTTRFPYHEGPHGLLKSFGRVVGAAQLRFVVHIREVVGSRRAWRSCTRPHCSQPGVRLPRRSTGGRLGIALRPLGRSRLTGLSGAECRPMVIRSPSPSSLFLPSPSIRGRRGQACLPSLPHGLDGHADP